MEPTAICSTDGSLGIEILSFEGSDRIANRDATGFYYEVRAEPGMDRSRLAVLFSGTSFLYKSSTFNLPEIGGRDATFHQFALAAVGEYLDRDGMPPFTPSGGNAAKVECFSSQFQLWLERTPATDDEIERYLKSRLYWDWRFGHLAAVLESHDVLRLRTTFANVDRIAQLESGHLWTIMERNASIVSLKPTPEFLRGERDRRQVAAVPVTDIVVASSLLATQSHVPKDDGDSNTPAVSAHISKKVRKPRASRAKVKASVPSTLVFVDEARLGDLRALSHPDFDFRRLIAICDELNVCYRSQCHIAVVGLIRALLDHIPPVFQCKSFAEVANNYAGGKSFRDAMQHLDGMARKIADGLLHTQIRRKESLPTRTQVDFSSGVDVLLAEVVRTLS